ncbi:sulfotransferase [Leptolyngbya sp. BC1307]|uniref:sulfotransferase n=1 Tax=Leptolyngbya sp. BC1307 TaxID=2029589 RepID=UPI000EFD8A8A|nr:sulfotransferase [Leptolyngbya sp. BC1307]
MSEFENHQFVFVCGLHRSGTSLLFKCIGEHPDISRFKDTGVPEDEGQHLQSVFKPASTYGGWGKFGFNKNAYLTEASSLVCDRNKARLFSEWQKFWDLEKTLLLEKSPPNLIRMRFLQAMFPNSYFIVLKRHPIAVSYATQKVNKKSIYSLIEHWLVCYEAGHQ